MTADLRGFRGARAAPDEKAATGWNLAPAIYGDISIGSVLAIESAQRETYADTLFAVVIALVLYWAAHAYAADASRRLSDRHVLTIGGLGRAMAHEMPIVLGAAFPTLCLLIGWAAGAPLTTAVNAGVWTSAGLVFVIELVAAVRTRRRPREQALQVLLGAGLGFGIVLLKIVLH